MVEMPSTNDKKFYIKCFDLFCSREYSGRILAVFYGAYLLIAGSICLIMTPPFQVPDEPSHFLRALQIAQGDIFVHRQSNVATGSYLPEDVVGMSRGFDAISTHPEVKVTPDEFYQALQVKWKSPVEFINLWNVDIYPPSSYIGSSVAVFIGRHLALMPLATFYLARIGNLIVAGAIGILALLLAEESGAFLALLLAFPMSISLTASCSQDSMIIALSALVAACLLRFSKYSKKWNIWLTITTGLGIGFMAAGKPPYMVFLTLVWLFYSKQNFSRIIIITCFSVGFFLFWMFFGLFPAAISFSSIVPGVSQLGQVNFLSHHILHSIRQFTVSTVLQFPLAIGIVGVLGWLDTFFSRAFYLFAYFAAITVFANTFLIKKTNLFSKKFFVKLFLYAFVLFVAYDMIFLALYLTWTPVGLDYVKGVQGRYLLPILMMFAVLPNLYFNHASNFQARSIYIGLEKVMLMAFMVFSTCSLFQVLSARFW